MTVFESEASKKALATSLDVILKNSVDASKNDTVPGAAFGVTNEKESVYINASGFADKDNGKKMSADTLFCLYSCSKAITVTGVLQLSERGIIDMDAPIKKYCPEITECGVISGFKDDGTPILERPTVDVTMKMLLTHTAGFSYTFFNENYLKIHEKFNNLNIFDVKPDTIKNSHLLFEPGTKWSYGMNIDWAGFVIEKVTGQTLGEYLQENIFIPADLKSFTCKLDSNELLTKLYFRSRDAVKLNSFQQQLDPVLHLGGSCIFGNIGDYLKFIRIWLNDGRADNGNQILSPETCRFALKNHLPDGLHVTSLPGVESHVTNPFSLDPSQEPDVWSLPFGITSNDSSTGRPKGTHYWCGIANLFYWIDTKNKVGGMWATQILPFLDPSLKYFAELETKVYENLDNND